MPIATALVLRVIRGYRPFPSVDDFIYIPVAWAANDPTLFPRDALLHDFRLHAPLWRAVVPLLEATTGLVVGFWCLTLALSLASVTALWRLLRATGVEGYLLPVAALIAFANPTGGLGRGQFDGAFGLGFHVQWLALTMLLWSYDAFVRGRDRITGVLLGVAAFAHPVVALHGAFVLAFASAAEGRSALRRLVSIGAACALVSAPVTVPLLLRLTTGVEPAWPAREIIEKGYLFRVPHEYGFEDIRWADVLLIVGVGILGAGALQLFRATGYLTTQRRLVWLFAGHAILLVCTVVLHSTWLDGSWRYVTLVPYMLHVSRTTPLFLVLGTALAVGAIEGDVSRRYRSREPTVSRLLIPLSFATLLIAATMPGAWLLVPLAAAGSYALVTATSRGSALAYRTAGLVSGLAAGILVLTTPVQARLDEEQAELYRWVDHHTPTSALFVVPPGMQQFRYYARRSVYVDFKLFSSANPAWITEWRRRLELVAAPDSTALSARGWPGLLYWDRDYTRHTTTDRIAQLLCDTEADYLVREGRAAGPRAEYVSLTFANERYAVYSLRRGQAGGVIDECTKSVTASRDPVSTSAARTM